MWHLMKSELTRFRTFAIAGFIVHMVALKGLSMIIGLFAQDAAKTSIGFLVYALTGLIFGLYQLGTYRKPSKWTYLIHRPLTPGQIFAAMSGAAAVLGLIVLAAPAFLMTFFTDFMSAEWVDGRHYFMPFFILGLAAAFYLAGCVIVLSSSRAAFLVLGLPTFFLTTEAVGLWIFVPMAAVLGWLAYLAWAAFKPNLTTPVRKPLPVAAMGVAMAYPLVWILSFGVQLGYSTLVAFQEHGWRSYAAHAWNEYFPEGTIARADYLPDDEVFLHGLVDDSERSQHLREQIQLADLFEVPGPRVARFPVVDQLMLADKYATIVDKENNVYWIFSHDRMLFHGRDMASGQEVGWLGTQGWLDEPNADQAFQGVPYVLSDYLMTAQQIYEYDDRRKSVDLRFQLAGDEIFNSPFRAHNSFVVAKSNKTLYFFEPRDLKDERGLLEASSAVALPGHWHNISRIHIAELIDSYLVSFILGANSERGFAEARQVMVEVGIDGGNRIVAERALGQGPPAYFRHRVFMLSPLLQYGHDLAWAAIGPYREERVTAADIMAHPPPTGMILTALLIAVLSAALAGGIAHRRGLSPAAVKAWVAGVFFLSLPGLVCFLFLAEKREQRGGERPSRQSLPLSMETSTGWSA